jgi:hypothetical protein
VGKKNYLVEGVSTSGKTSVCDELLRRGHHAVHGDRQLAYRGDPATGATVETGGHENHLWDLAKVRALIADKSVEATFFCGGSRNYPAFIDLFDAVFVLTIDRDTLLQRLDGRPDEEFGARPDERALVKRLHASGEDTLKALPSTPPHRSNASSTTFCEALSMTIPHWSRSA